MKKILSAAAMAAAGAAAIAVTSGALAGPAPASGKNHPFFANAHWDDDWEDRRRYGPMPVPSVDAIKRAGIVHVVEIERDDGLIEVQGYDAEGRKVELVMDRQGRRVLSVERDRHRGH